MVDHKSWPHLIDTDDLSKRKLQAVYRAPTAEMICYLDFSVSTTGMLAGIKVRLGTTAAVFIATSRTELYFQR